MIGVSVSAIFLFVALLVNIAADCDVSYKVYVYPLPSHLLFNAQQARLNKTYHICQKCIYEQFALEYIIYDHFTQHCARTTNPSEADYFYLPIIRDIDYRIALNNKGNRKPSYIEETLLAVLERHDFSLWKLLFQVPDTYWKNYFKNYLYEFRRHNGSDHILVMPAPVTNFRHQSNMRGFFHYMPQLYPPIFLSVELSRSFVEEYPYCAKSKNIVMPYPITDSKYFTGQYFLPPTTKRNKLIYYHGGMHGSCVYVRLALNHINTLKQLVVLRGDRKREEGFQQAVFCPLPIGDSPSSKRMYDVIMYGCIPVLLSDDVVYAFSKDACTTERANIGGSLGDELCSLDPWKFSIQLPQTISYASPRYILHSLQHTNYSFMPATGHSMSRLVYSIMKKLVKEDNARNVSSVAHLLDLDSGTVHSGHRNEAMRRLKARRMNPQLFSKLLMLLRPDQNTFVRFLQALPKEVILSMQEEVNKIRHLYQYYSMRKAVEKGGAGQALTAKGERPTGGAMQMLDKILDNRRGKKSLEIAKLCEQEVKTGRHKYVNQYPCPI